MSNVAKDEAELIERMAEGLHNDYDLNLPEKYRGSFRTVRPPESCDIIVGSVTAVLAAIRAAGWAVVPVALMEEAVEELEEMNDSHYHHREKYPEEQRRYERDMELPRAIRAMLAAAPGVKP